MAVSIACYGGGINSTAMICGLINFEEYPTKILFSDTGGEKPETYDYLHIFNTYLQKHGLELTILKKNSKHITLEKECLDNSRLPGLAYGNKQCSYQWKVQPQIIFCNNWNLAIQEWRFGRKVIKYLGFDIGEKRRMFAQNIDEKYAHRYPLIQWEYDREECIKLIKLFNLPIPPKSSCFFCPATKKSDLLQLNVKHPELVKRAIELEDRGNEAHKVEGLSRTWSWRNFLYDANYNKGCETEMPCDCYDDSED